jgi:hypothetical protein
VPGVLVYNIDVSTVDDRSRNKNDCIADGAFLVPNGGGGLTVRPAGPWSAGPDRNTNLKRLKSKIQGIYHLGPKRKKTKTFQEAISPKSEWNLPSWFGFGAYQAKLIFKMPLPQIDIDLVIVKNNPISCSPNYPAGSDDYFSEICIAKCITMCWCFVDRLVNLYECHAAPERR